MKIIFRALMMVICLTAVTCAAAISPWIQTPSPLPDFPNAITFGAGKFVIVGAGGKIFTSTNAVDWSEAATGTTNTLADVAFKTDTFVALGDQTTLLSTNGLNWTPVNQLASRGSDFRSISVAGDRFVTGILDEWHAYESVPGAALLIFSTDGHDWTSSNLRGEVRFSDLTFLQTPPNWPLASGGIASVSPLPISGLGNTLPQWGRTPTQISLGLDLHDSHSQKLTAAAYGNGRYLTIRRTLRWRSGFEGSTPFEESSDIWTSPDFQHWSPLGQIDGKKLLFWNGLFYSPSLKSNAVSSSPDGSIWTQHVSPGTNAVPSALTVFNDELWALGAGFLAHSPDANTWTLETNLPANPVGISWGNNTLVITAKDTNSTIWSRAQPASALPPVLPSLSVAARDRKAQTVGFQITGVSSSSVQVESSTNLLDWLSLPTLTNQAGIFTVPMARQREFFRLRQ